MEFKDWLDLNEIFDTPVLWRWMIQDPTRFRAIFGIKEKEYIVSFYDPDKKNSWYLSFKQEYHPTGFGITHTGDAGQVMATVLAIIKDFENRIKPDHIEFEGYGKSRNDLYQKMLKKYLPPQYTKTQFGSKFNIRRVGA